MSKKSKIQAKLSKQATNSYSISQNILRVMREQDKALTFNEQLLLTSYFMHINSFNPYEVWILIPWIHEQVRFWGGK